MAAAIPARDPKWMDLFERNFVIKFLFGLNDSYEHIRESIVMMDPLPDLEKALHMVIQHEHQQEMKQTPQSGSVVFQMSSSNIQSPSYESGYSVNQADNYLGNNEVIGAVSGGYKPRQRPICTYCGLQGHLVTRCYKLHGYPPGYKPPSQSYGSPQGTPQQGVSQSNFAPKQYQPRPPAQFPQQQYGQQVNSNPRMQNQRGPKDNVVGSVVLTNSPAVQDHFHQVSNALAQLSPEQIEQLASQLTTKASCQMPSINEIQGVNYASTSAGNVLCTTLPESCLTFTAWIIDSGATTHVCCNLSLFDDINSISETTVKLPNSAQITINKSDLTTSTLDLFSPTVLPLPIHETSPISTSSPLPLNPEILSDNNGFTVASDNTIPVTAARPKRNTRTPSYLSDYHCNLVCAVTPTSGTTAHPLSSVLDYSKLNTHYQQFILNISSESEPKNFLEAVKSEKWHGPMNEELQTCVDTG
ncbi:unnamed protein product, partial [Arabidopsis halleri]